ncbi:MULTISPECIES: response regulator [Paraburkholderia]|uniref:response regulator n=1 Tax=Paraburkholderia TaxID=1822464 RepID=UPI002254594B|nr:MULTISPECIES: response regulator [Paraburkholderia]MCX4162876.1 response regulator [Paraburkholderia megapolitana]MDN7158372.1 response regulator [Paraburkholderia sp. CHISQ3]MDQ6495419.1 response regulator [Paraburkholderia megapolitana]
MTTILLVEDDLNLLRALETLLKGHGYRVRTAADGLLAIRSARAERPDIVVSDWMMPGMDGIALIDALKSVPQLADVPVVLTSAVGPPPAIPISGFLRKPFPAATLLDLLRRIVKS